MSLRMRLLAIIGLSLTVLWSVVAIWMFVEVRTELGTVLDGRLAASARMVAGLLSQFPTTSLASNGQHESPLDVIARDGLACEVSLLRGEVAGGALARTAGSPRLIDAEPGYSTHVFDGKVWRAYVLEQGNLRIATADQVDVRMGLLRDIALTIGVPFVIALSGSLLMLRVGIGRGLAPIERIRLALAERRPDEEAPLPEPDVPPELRPLTDTIHQLLERVRGTITRERRFTDDAAHELRTPLTAIKTHLQVLRLAAARPADAETAASALSSAEQGVLRLHRTLDQLLLLARLDSGEDQYRGTIRSSAGASARLAVEDARGDWSASERMTLQIGPEEIEVAVPEALLVSALRNLLDNAIRHSPAESPVVLRVECAELERVSFSVLDSGPGLSDEECVLALQRFWRRGAGAQGSGLGLSIVMAIAQRHGGSLSLRKRGDSGLEARLTFPVLARADLAAANSARQ